mmetsp:Transcript_44938/g.74978  ORF Transcript_44938/g.74978 Transcript_44938/m.74978 type:complete len:246 (-) Transcript_44938:42-779(-)
MQIRHHFGPPLIVLGHVALECDLVRVQRLLHAAGRLRVRIVGHRHHLTERANVIVLLLLQKLQSLLLRFRTLHQLRLHRLHGDLQVLSHEVLFHFERLDAIVEAVHRTPQSPQVRQLLGHLALQHHQLHHLHAPHRRVRVLLHALQVGHALHALVHLRRHRLLDGELLILLCALQLLLQLAFKPVHELLHLHRLRLFKGGQPFTEQAHLSRGCALLVGHGLQFCHRANLRCHLSCRLSDGHNGLF